MKYLLLLVVVCGSSVVSADQPVDFTREVRPILTNRCFRCHGPDDEQLQAGLRLDSQKFATAKLESGKQAIIPGKPEQSALIKRVTSTDEFERMPPTDSGDALSPKEVEVLKRWIAQGANYEEHWAWVPPREISPPQLAGNSAWVQNGIDPFILRRLQQAKLTPAAEADRAVLIRRVSLDLTGLPPTVEEVETFLNDKRPDAYENLVNRLLASPAFGERWGRVWLDLARYADSAGYAQDPARVIWRYRDWVIDALNSNLAFDEFTVQQLAGDLLPNPTPSQILATAFHRNTMTNSEGGTDDEEFRTAAIVDRVNTTMQVWMGVTMGCAQCHTHKYDPITQEEYFQFYAVFNQTADADRGDESPTQTFPTHTTLARRAEIEQQIAEVESLIKKLPKQTTTELDYLSGDLTPRFIRVEHLGNKVFLSLAEVQAFVGKSNVALKGTATQSSTDYNGPAKLAIDGNTDGNYNEAKSTTHSANENQPWWEVDLKSPQAIEKVTIWNRTDGVGNRLNEFRVVGLDTERRPLWVKTISTPPNPSVEISVPVHATKLSATDREQLLVYKGKQPPSTVHHKRLAELKKKLAAQKGVTTPIMQELSPDKHRKTFIQIRGNFLDKGEEVTAGVPAAFHDLEDGLEPNRLNVARWIVSEKNPLTARVTVNRFWEELFGRGLVETSEDFGLQGEPPTHPELLDFLATNFMREQWDIKQLLKLMVTSATYRQSSELTAEKKSLDPRNELFSRGPRFRLSAEMIRDQALFVSGLLSQKMKGESVRPPQPILGIRAAFGGSTDWQPSPGEDKFRRGLYTSWRRTAPYPSMTTFDAPSREVCTIRRIRTNTPLQALVTMNDPVFVEASQALARRMIREGGSTLTEQLRFGFRLSVSREPSDKELASLQQLYQQVTKRFAADQTAATQLATNPIGPVPPDMNVQQLAALTLIGNVLLNLDEVLARR